jgi:hypothetical protein
MAGDWLDFGLVKLRLSQAISGERVFKLRLSQHWNIVTFEDWIDGTLEDWKDGKLE